jgi:glycosyltransferase involved in cell wall biosynthesis
VSSRVVWDGRWAGRHGIARHAHEVGRRLEGSYHILKPGRVSPTSPIDALYLRGVLRLGRGDLFVTPGFNASLAGPYRQLVTVHDLIHLRVDDESSRAKRLYYKRVVLPAIRSSQRVLTGSQFSRNELIAWTGLPPEAVVAVGYGCSFPPATRAERDGAAATEGRTVLFVGNPKPHKNLSLVVAALRHMSADVRVVTVGVPYDYVAEKCEAYGVALSRFNVLQRLSDAELRELYIAAACVALPSTYEGFGLAALEGMAVGTATAYACDAVDEVVGPLGFRSASTTDGEAYADVLAKAMAIDGSARRNLIARAKTFSWDDTAKLVEQQIGAMSK